MWTSSFVKAGMLSALACASVALAQSTPPGPRIFGTARAEEVYRVVLDRDALLLESIADVIKQKGIRDGHVMVTAGSLQECTYHYVVSNAKKPKDEYKTVKEPMEILSGGGIIADGLPHLHIALSSPGKGAFGGHLENGCKILYLGEVTIVKYTGEALTRKPNENGVGILTTK
jgi:predicted DNA-binding protein with PD1-like motif